MVWLVVDTILCPKTGTAFATIRSSGNLRIIVWYSSDTLLSPGDVIYPFKDGIIVNNKKWNAEFYKTQLINRKLWQMLKDKTDCPANRDNLLEVCPERRQCCFKKCPYGLARD